MLPGLALATVCGLLIGVERGWRLREEQPGRRVAGIRTFALLGLLGGLAGLASATTLDVLAYGLAGGAVLALLLGYLVDMRADANVSATSLVAAVLTILLGALATTGQPAIASIGTATTVMLLASREALHGALKQMRQDEITALLRLALVTFLVLPLLPDTAIGPFGGINPRKLWFVVVVVGAISLSGYLLTRWLGGSRGALMTALAGATVSSTAVTIDAARRVRESGGDLVESSTVAIASSVMIARVAVLVSLFAPAALADVLRLLTPAFVVSLAISAVQARAALKVQAGAGPASGLRPPTLWLAFLFAGLVAVISIAARWAELRFGGGGGAVVIAIGGMVDVDSAVAAIGALPPEAVTPRLAAIAIAAPVAFNSLLKLALFVGIAGMRHGRRAALGLGVTALVIVASVLGVVLPA